MDPQGGHDVAAGQTRDYEAFLPLKMPPPHALPPGSNTGWSQLLGVKSENESKVVQTSPELPLEICPPVALWVL